MKIFISTLLFCAIAFSLRAQTLGTCQIFPSNNPWNERVDSLPVHWNSDKYIANVGGTLHLHPDFGSNALYGIPWVAVSSTQAMVPIIFDQNSYTDQSDPGPMPIPLNAPIEGGGNDGGDDHVLVVDTSNHHLYELYQGSRSGNGWRATSSAIFALDSNNFRPDGWTSCDAAGLPIWPGLVRKYECDAGEIKHALRFTVQHTQKGWIFPARHEAGSTTDMTVMPMGLRLRLKANFPDSNFTGDAKVITTAMKRYGIILADNGSNWFISGETNTSWPDDDINQLKQITGNDFEAVYTGPVRTQPNQYPDPALPIPSQGGTHITSITPSFGTVPIGQADTMPYSIQNSGTLTIIITNLQILNSDFTFVPIPAIPDTLQPGTKISLAIRFAPSKVGGDTGLLQLSFYSTGFQKDTILSQLIGEGAPSAGVSTEPGRSFDLDIFPNPSRGIATISIIGAVGPSQIEITDAIGRTVLREAISSGSGALDLSGLPNGFYFLHAQTSKGNQSKLIEVVH